MWLHRVTGNIYPGEEKTTQVKLLTGVVYITPEEHQKLKFVDKKERSPFLRTLRYGTKERSSTLEPRKDRPEYKRRKRQQRKQGRRKSGK